MKSNQAVNNKKTNIFLSFIMNFIKIFKYFYIGIKACTYDLFVYLYNALSWKLDKAYRRTKEVITKEPSTGGVNIFEGMNNPIYEEEKNTKKKKKEKIYTYSPKKMAKLEKEYQELVKDLQTTGATRTKEANCYLYKVRAKNGKILTGTMNGLSKLDINSFLTSEGYQVYSIKTSPLINFIFKESDIISPKLSTKELVFWLTQLSTYLKAGITLNDAIKILSKQMKSKKSKERAFKSISYELTLGETFSNALEKQGNMFPALLINMIRAAEASGTLTETLDDMANYYTEMDNTKKQMKSAMTYPAVITIFATGVVIFILVFIIPKFIDIYNQSGIELSGITLAVVNFSNFLKLRYAGIIGFILVLIIVYYLCYKYIKAFRKTMQTIFMHIPVVKNVIIYNELTIFTKTFASLLRNNVFITDSMSILTRITNNEIYKEILYKTINNIVKGEKISEAFKDQWAVPEVAYFMIVTGESTGELAEMMQKVSEYYQEMHRGIVNNLKAFIEPIMISALAIVVGFILVAVIVPMFQLYDKLL